MLDYRKEFQLYRKYYFYNFYRRPSTQVSLGLLLTIGLISTLVFLALKPTLTTIASLTQDIKVRKEFNANLEQKINSLKQAQAVYNQVSNQIVYLDNSLPVESSFTRLEREIELLTVNHNLVISGIDFGRFDISGVPPYQAGEEKYLKLSFHLTLGGSYKDLKEFLQDLENLDRIIVVEQIAFSDKTRIEGAQLSAQITGWASYFPMERYKQLQP